jgi:uncharacterized membrane protein
MRYGLNKDWLTETKIGFVEELVEPVPYYLPSSNWTVLRLILGFGCENRTGWLVVE